MRTWLRWRRNHYSRCVTIKNACVSICITSQSLQKNRSFRRSRERLLPDNSCVCIDKSRFTLLTMVSVLGNDYQILLLVTDNDMAQHTKHYCVRHNNYCVIDLGIKLELSRAHTPRALLHRTANLPSMRTLRVS